MKSASAIAGIACMVAVLDCVPAHATFIYLSVATGSASSSAASGYMTSATAAHANAPPSSRLSTQIAPLTLNGSASGQWRNSDPAVMSLDQANIQSGIHSAAATPGGAPAGSVEVVDGAGDHESLARESFTSLWAASSTTGGVAFAESLFLLPVRTLSNGRTEQPAPPVSEHSESDHFEAPAAAVDSTASSTPVTRDLVTVDLVSSVAPPSVAPSVIEDLNFATDVLGGTQTLAVPDPATIGLLGMGMLFTFVATARRQRRAQLDLRRR